jgi:carbon-monoxide dehydrogenase medium subunit
LLPTIKQRLAAPAGADRPVEESRSCQGFRLKATDLTLGAMTRHVDVAESELVSQPDTAACQSRRRHRRVPRFATAARSAARSANNDPSADYPAAAVLALDATVVTDRREIAADAFFRGFVRKRALDPGEIITGLALPGCRPPEAIQIQIAGVAHAVVGVCVAKKPERFGSLVTGAGPGVVS